MSNRGRRLIAINLTHKTINETSFLLNFRRRRVDNGVNDGDAERALVLSALAGRYPYVANSRWIADIVGGDVDEWAASLAPDAATAARARGRALDLWETAEELIVEFGGDSVLR